jgi:hypothetical protein
VRAGSQQVVQVIALMSGQGIWSVPGVGGLMRVLALRSPYVDMWAVLEVSGSPSAAEVLAFVTDQQARRRG